MKEVPRRFELRTETAAVSVRFEPRHFRDWRAYCRRRFLARRDAQVGKVRLGTAAHPETNGTGLGCGFGFRQREFLLAVGRHSDPRVVDVELERDPFVVGNIGAGLVALVRILLAQPAEFPVRIGEVLDRALVARGGRIFLTAVERAQIDRLEARLVVDAVGEPDERPRVRQTLSVETAEKVDLDRTVLKLVGMSTKVGMSPPPPGRSLLAASVNSTLSALRPLYSAGSAVTLCRVAPSGTSCRA